MPARASDLRLDGAQTAHAADRTREMLARMWKATLRGLFPRGLRLPAILAGAVLGVAFVSATYVLPDTLSAVIDHLFVDATSGVDVTVRPTSALADNAGLTGDTPRL